MTESETEETAAEITAEEVEESSETASEPTSKKSGFSHTVRHKDGGTVTIKNYSMAKAIKICCVDCLGYESDPKQCIDKLCPLFPYKGSIMVTKTRQVYRTPSNEQIQKMPKPLLFC